MKAYFSYINARRGPDGKRGVYGRQIVFKYYDDGYNPVNSVQQQRRLVEQDKVFAVVGTLGTEVNQAVQPYLNSNKVPHVLVSTGASDFGKDYRKYPWTIGWQPDYVAEGRLYGSDINKNHPNAKIAILYQDDSYGKDYVAGFKSALGTAKVKSQVVREEAVRARQRPAAVAADPAAELRRRHADDLRHADADDPGVRGSPRAQLEAGQHLRELGLGDRHVHGSRGRARSNAATVNGSISAQYLKDPASPAWANDATVKQYLTLMAKYNPSGRVTDGLNFYGFAKADTFVRAMYKAGKNPTRAGLMRALLSFNETSPFLLPGSKLKTSATDHFIISHQRLMHVQQRASGPGPAHSSTDGRAASPTARKMRWIVGAGDGPHVVLPWTSPSPPSRS